ncbi:MAG: SRPBCC family protein [Polyangiales bacterium]
MPHAASPASPAIEGAILVRKSLTIAAPPARCFAVFTERFADWWPLASHHTAKVAAQTALIEPRVGGRWFERGVDGSETPWGHVLAWEPPHRLVLSWELGADFQPDAAMHTEVEVTFTAAGTGTRVDLEHRLLEAYGAKALEMRGIFDSDGGWAGLLGKFADLARLG